MKMIDKNTLQMFDVHRGAVQIDVRQRGTVFVDIDGTVADLTHRRPYVATSPKNWAAFNKCIPDDAPIWPVINDVKALKEAGWTVVMVSGRSEKTKDATEEWLKKYGVPYDALYMRKEYLRDKEGNTVISRRGEKIPDTRNDAIVKKELLDEAIRDGYRPTIVFDDRDRVVQMWRDNGIPVVQVAEGDF